VPAYAWTWLQRSRPVLLEVAQRLHGGPPPAGYVRRLREEFESDPFARDVVVGTIVDVAFAGRIPIGRAQGTTWDRGLTWWAAAIAGVSPVEFETRPVGGRDRRLFEPEPPSSPPAPPRRPARGPTAERLALARALRELVAASDGDQVPASAVRQLITQLEGSRAT
jgi:hypothetical protein